MSLETQPIKILIADDDDEDRFMAKEAFEAAHLKNELVFVEDGEDLMDYLYQRGKYIREKEFSLPGLILLDLNMPRKDGREALKEIKADPTLKVIPVIVFTTSSEEEDIFGSYNLGANSFISKPVSFEGLLKIIQSLNGFWIEIVKLPGQIL